MRNYISVHEPNTFDVRPPETEGTGPRLWIDTGKVTIFFDDWKQFEQLKDECNRAWYAFQAEEEHRQAAADIDDDSASRNGDRNHELTMAMGGPVV